MLDAKGRGGKTPFVIGAGGIRLKVDSALVAVCEDRLDAWRTLQELAGLVTPFSGDVEAKLRF